LRRFRDAFYLKLPRIKNINKQKAAAIEISLFRPVARIVVSGMTFQNHEKIQNYFSAATNKTFELVAERGEAQPDFTPLFADLQADNPQKNDGF